MALITDLGVAEVAGVGWGGVTDAAGGVDIGQERPSARQGHVDNQTGLKHEEIRSNIEVLKNNLTTTIHLI